jgi:hypothetical protein
MNRFARDILVEGSTGTTVADHALERLVRCFDADLADRFGTIIHEIQRLEHEAERNSGHLLEELKTQRLMFREEILDFVEAQRRAVA